MHRYYSYRVEPRDNKFVVVCEQDGTLYGSYDDEDTASFVADEAYCDDAAMIAHEAST